MPRKRMIDPEFWSDEEIAGWSPLARLFYIGLWNFADDEGKLKAHPSLLKSQIFPYESKVDIEALKSEIGHKVMWYESDGYQYGYLRNFLKYQRIDRPTKSHIPEPKALDESSTSPRRSLAPNIIEDNTREEMFLEFWSIYPLRDGKKLGKQETRNLFNKLSPEDCVLAVRAARNFSESAQVKKGYGIPDAHRFLYSKSKKTEPWREWIEPPVNSGGGLKCDEPFPSNY